MPASAAPLTALSGCGLGLGLSLIVAIGSHHANVLRQGLLGEHVLPVLAGVYRQLAAEQLTATSSPGEQ